MCFILSLPDDWEFNIDWLRKNVNVGRDKALRIVNELITLGYCKRVQPSGSRGRFDAVEYHFSDDPTWASPQPDFQGAVTQDVVPPQPGFPTPDLPGAVNPPPIDNKYTKDKFHSSHRAAPSGAANDEFDFCSGEVKPHTPAADDITSAEKRPTITIEKGSSMYRPDAQTREQARKLARGWDIDGPDGLVAEFNAMNEGNTLYHPDKAFLGWCEKKGAHPDCYNWKPTGKPPPPHLQPKDGEVAIVKLSAEWDRWLDHVHKLDRPAADRMRAVFVVFAPSKNPIPGSTTLPRIPQPERKSA